MRILSPYYRPQTDYEKRLRDQCEKLIVESIKASRKKKSTKARRKPEQMSLFE